MSKRLVYIQLSDLVKAVGRNGNTGEIGYYRLAQLFGVCVQSDVLFPKLDQLIAACLFGKCVQSGSALFGVCVQNNVLFSKLDQLIADCGWTKTLKNGEKVVQISRNANYKVYRMFLIIYHVTKINI